MNNPQALMIDPDILTSAVELATKFKIFCEENNLPADLEVADVARNVSTIKEAAYVRGKNYERDRIATVLGLRGSQVCSTLFDCNCSLTTKLVGDGCQVCNTEYALSLFPQPEEVRIMLQEGGFISSQADIITTELYQPMMSIIHTLSDKIDQLAKCINNPNTEDVL